MWKITLKDLINSDIGDLIINMLIDVTAFTEFDMRQAGM
jgi:hypothetical protein